MYFYTGKLNCLQTLRMQYAAASHVKFSLLNDILYFSLNLCFASLFDKPSPSFWSSPRPVFNEKIPSACPSMKALYVCRFFVTSSCFSSPYALENRLKNLQMLAALPRVSLSLYKVFFFKIKAPFSAISLIDWFYAHFETSLCGCWLTNIC